MGVLPPAHSNFFYHNLFLQNYCKFKIQCYSLYMNVKNIQNFNLHAHHGGFGLFNGKRTGADGHNNAVRMLQTAKSRGFETYALVAHLDFNRHIKFDGMKKYEGMTQFNDIKCAIADYKRAANAVREAAKTVPGIKTLVGFEVDFYRGKDWLEDFNVIKNNIDYDFLIGSTHSISNSDGTKCRSMYFMDPTDFTYHAVHNYYQNIEYCISSGLFDFIAHIDLIRDFVPKHMLNTTDAIDDIIKLLNFYNMPTEINTSGFRKKDFAGYPEQTILNKLAKSNIPVFISDDAHNIKSVGENFALAANCLNQAGIKKYTLSDILGVKHK